MSFTNIEDDPCNCGLIGCVSAAKDILDHLFKNQKRASTLEFSNEFTKEDVPHIMEAIVYDFTHTDLSKESKYGLSDLGVSVVLFRLIATIDSRERYGEAEMKELFKKMNQTHNEFNMESSLRGAGITRIIPEKPKDEI